MFQRLKEKWEVNNLDLILILCVFAVTGSATAYISRYITEWIGLTANDALWKRAGLRGLVLVFGYQFIILLVSIPFGQFKFFWRFISKFWQRLGLLKKS